MHEKVSYYNNVLERVFTVGILWKRLERNAMERVFYYRNALERVCFEWYMPVHYGSTLCDNNHHMPLILIHKFGEDN